MLNNRFGAFFLDILQTVVLAAAIFLISYLFLFQPHHVDGHSMDPNFDDGEYLLTDKVSYKFGEPKRGDVIVFKAPPSPGEDYIKRIIGLPGETISLQEGKVYVNNNLLKEDYIPKNFITIPGTSLPKDKPFTVPQDEYFVMGDNREHSNDSRTWGAVKKKAIKGRAWLVYWPPKRAGFIKY